MKKLAETFKCFEFVKEQKNEIQLESKHMVYPGDSIFLNGNLVGTVGCFLVDADKTIYAISCKHILPEDYYFGQYFVCLKGVGMDTDVQVNMKLVFVSCDLDFCLFQANEINNICYPVLNVDCTALIYLETDDEIDDRSSGEQSQTYSSLEDDRKNRDSLVFSERSSIDGANDAHLDPIHAPVDELKILADLYGTLLIYKNGSVTDCTMGIFHSIVYNVDLDGKTYRRLICVEWATKYKCEEGSFTVSKIPFADGGDSGAMYFIVMNENHLIVPMAIHVGSKPGVYPAVHYSYGIPLADIAKDVKNKFKELHYTDTFYI